MNRLGLVLLVLGLTAEAAPKKKALAKPPSKPVTVSLASVVDASNTPGGKDAGVAALNASLLKWKVTLAPPGESEAAAKKALEAKKAVGVELSLTLKPGKGEALDASMILSTYPGHVLKAEYRAGGGGGSLIELIPPVVDQLVADVAKDEGWSRAP
ncbi:MAG: hypothetical protein Q8S33_33570 [Myxococcales bacterium]|nr:hypothetical protein [Myxococcales bacterium]